ncbi:ABC transporter permease [Citricoccus sp. K5]|uniref:ABC transporter permease n=1 Tax=Citricoccus sp. K5 TaxID=2653135 RepID=UPI00135C5DD6|nr:ABC transporter permease [Citricoccus sp. K5]
MANTFELQQPPVQSEPTDAKGSSPVNHTSKDTPKVKKRWIDFALDNIVWILLVVFVLIGALMNPFFLSVPNFQNILVQATTLGFLGVAIAMCMLLGEIDLSVVGILGFSGAVGAVAMQNGVPGFLGILIVLGIGALIGFINGICVAKLRMTSLIETLAMGLVLGGGVLAITRGQTVSITEQAFTWLGQGRIATWPVMPIALVLLFVAVTVFLYRTPMGRKIYAAGGNRRAAYAAGINTKNLVIATFTFSGLLAAVAGWLTTAYLGGVNPTLGSSDMLLYAIAAPVIGGVALTGGRGATIGILGGVLLLTVVQVGLQVINIDAYYVGVVGGAMIFLAVIVDAIRVRRRQAAE